MKLFFSLLISLFIGFNIPTAFSQQTIPHLANKGSHTQLIVQGKPFIILGGELGNSSATTMDYMAPIWPKLSAMNINTVLVPVYWELMEPEEGMYDFKLLSDLILEARKQNMKIVFLWFGSWKNSMSSHAPAWVKHNQQKYPRVKDDKGRSHEILTPFSKANLQADLRAFEHLMKFIRDFDEDHNTVIMVQVENEIGMLPTARDYHPLANEAFYAEVPNELIAYMQRNRDNLVPEFRQIWKKNGFKTSGAWEEVFGKGLHTDEIFMAWYFSEFANQIAKAGKKIYPLPMFVNAALNRPGREPGSGYPSAGPLPHLMDVWKAAGDAIDFLSPDFYNPDFKHWNDLYTRQGDPLFIPEHRFDNTVAAKAMYAVGHYRALGFSPFSIESTESPFEEPLGKMYNLIHQIAPIYHAALGKSKIDGVLLDHENKEVIISFGETDFIIRHDFTLGWSPGSDQESWPLAGAMIIQTGPDEFFVAGSGVVITFKHNNDEKMNVGILKNEEGSFVDGSWAIMRHLNGDQTHQGRHVRIPNGLYSIQRLELYTYE